VYQERRDGRLRFEVRADWSAENADGTIRLRNVGLTRFDERGSASNIVSGKEALYDPEGKHIQFSGDVHLRLADGTNVYSNNISADLKSEIVNISEAFRFEHGGASGSGEALEYRIEPKQVYITGEFHLTMPAEPGHATIEADRAFHDLDGGIVYLTGNATITGRGNRLSASRVNVEMTEQNRIRRLEGLEKGELQIGEDRFFQGERIEMLFDPAENRLTTLDVSGNGTPQKKAIYREETPRGTHYLEALRIIASPETEGEQVVLRDFRADGSVLFRSRSLGITEARADHLIGFLGPEGKNLERVHLEGGVSVLRQLEPQRTRNEPADSRVSERLTSEELDLRFGEGQVLETASALRNVELKRTGGAIERSLIARDSVQLFYSDGQLSRSESRGDSRLTEEFAGGRRTATAPSLDAFYRDGRIERIVGTGGVTLSNEEKGVKRTSTSRTLEARWAGGQLTEVFQRGDVRLNDEQENSRLVLRGDSSRYDAKAEVLEIWDGSPMLRYSETQGERRQETETVAERITIDRGAGRIQAQGSVKTLLTQGGDLIMVEAGRMEGDRESGSAVYSQSPRITQKAGSVSGEVIRYNSKAQTVYVDNDVVSNLTDERGRKYRVSAEHLVYDRSSGRARYEESVEVTGPDINLKAPFVELIFEEGRQNRVSQVVAWGGVEVVQGDKKARGQRAIYFPETQKVEMTAAGMSASADR